MAKTLYISDLRPNDIGRDELFSIKEVQKHSTKTGEPYYRITLKDRTGIITARIWKDSFGACNVDKIQPGDAVSIDFEVNSYNGENQVIIQKLKKVEEYDMYELMNTSSKNLEEQWQKVQKYIDSINDADYKELLNKVFSDSKIKDLYMRSPAAELVHHDFVGGLVEHVLEMLSMADAVMPFYPVINRDLVIVGIILHDIGKIYEIGLEETTFIRTKAGYLLGHIMIGSVLINKIFPADFDEDKKMQVEHIILSHHGELEMGAPVRPATIEATVVSVVDRASDHIRQCEKELAQAMPDKYGFGKFHKYMKTKIFIGTKSTNNNSIKEETSAPDSEN